MYKPTLRPTLEAGYAYASSRRFPKQPDTVMTSEDDAPRYRYVGVWLDAMDGQRRYMAFRKQSGDGPRYLFKQSDFAPRYR
jgi:hypothetical protein